MALDDRSRMLLHQRLDDVLGRDEADVLMAHLPPSGWGDVATKGDLDLTRAATRADVERATAELRVEIIEMRTEIKGDIAELRNELHRSQRQLTLSLVGIVATMNSVVAALVIAVG